KGVAFFKDANGISSGNLPMVLDNGSLNLQLEALRTNSMARSLAEPNLTTLNGHPATFFSGSEFAVPVITGATATGLQGVSFVPAGVTLTFLPVISDRDRIRLTINATVSAINSELTNAGSPGLNATTI